jgi:hypothetical protein
VGILPMEENPMRTRITFFGAVALVLTPGRRCSPIWAGPRHRIFRRRWCQAQLGHQSPAGDQYRNWRTGQNTVPMLGGKIWQAAGNLRTWERACLPEIKHGLPTRIFCEGPEILPGWSLRLDVIDGGEGYDLLLEDTTDRTCGYAAATDERGLIRQSKSIDCPI